MIQLLTGVLIGCYFADSIREIAPILDPNQKEGQNEATPLA